MLFAWRCLSKDSFQNSSTSEVQSQLPSKHKCRKLCSRTVVEQVGQPHHGVGHVVAERQVPRDGMARQRLDVPRQVAQRQRRRPRYGALLYRTGRPQRHRRRSGHQRGYEAHRRHRCSGVLSLFASY